MSSRSSRMNGAYWLRRADRIENTETGCSVFRFFGRHMGVLNTIALPTIIDVLFHAI